MEVQKHGLARYGSEPFNCVSLQEWFIHHTW